jgi:RNA polymerase sigma-70 factor (ECF subfamily)
MAARDPLENPAALIRRVYSYVAFAIGDGPDAEDVTSSVFERAMRYRDSYDPVRGTPLAWLLGIARHCVDDAARQRRYLASLDGFDPASSQALESETVQRLTVAGAVGRLDQRARELLALRYGADLSARQIGEIMDMKTNAVEVALHRTLARLRADLEDPAGTVFRAVESAPQSSS